jgi:hypothetical protein
MAAGFVLGVMLLFGIRVGAAPPFDRQVQWSNPTTYSDLTPIAATDNLVTHIFVCASATDNATCVEVGASGLNSTAWSGTVLQQPVDATRYWRLRSESKLHLQTSVYGPSTAFFLKGTAAPAEPGAPAVQ